MKRLIGLMLTAAFLGLAGCTTTETDKYTADEPPPLARRGAASTEIEPVNLTTARAPLTADEVNEANAHDSLRRLEGELKTDGRSTTKTGH
jgi:hypothetical protein